MTSRAQAAQDPPEGYTLLACCGSSGCGAHPRRGPVEESLLAIVRRSRHGVLAKGDCVLGRFLCHTCGPRGGCVDGTFVLVQPCTARRRPTGPAVPVGPLSTADDLVALSRWLRGGELTIGSLPRRLQPPLAPLYAAARN